MMETGSLAGAPKWMKRLGTGFCVVEEDGGYYRISAQSAVQQWQMATSGWAHHRDGIAFLRLHWKEGGRPISWCTRQYTQERNGGFGVYRQDGGKVELSPPSTQDRLRSLAQWCERSKRMPWHWADATLCMHHGQEALPLQLELIDRGHSEGLQLTGSHRMDERLRSVSPYNFNTSPVNSFGPCLG